MNKYNAYLDWDATNKNTYEIIIEDKLTRADAKILRITQITCYVVNTPWPSAGSFLSHCQRFPATRRGRRHAKTRRRYDAIARGMSPEDLLLTKLNIASLAYPDAQLYGMTSNSRRLIGLFWPHERCKAFVIGFLYYDRRSVHGDMC